MIVKYTHLKRVLLEQKNYFIQTLSHDLRVSTIAQIRALELLQKKPTNNNFSIIEDIQDSCLFTLDMINMLLNSYRYENGEQILKYEICSVTEIINNTNKNLFKFLEDKKISLNILANKNTFIEADKQALSKVFSTLISTAIFYSENNSIINISAETKKQELIVEIKYRGKKLSPEEQKRMFNKNSKFSTVGHGIRMHLCKKIIDYHNGKIEVNNIRENINSFTFKIPVQNREKAQRQSLITNFCKYNLLSN